MVFWISKCISSNSIVRIYFLLQICDAGKNYKNFGAPFMAKKNCSGQYFYPVDLPVVDKQTLLDRAGFFKEDLGRKKPLICEGHIEILDKNFRLLSSKNCLHPGHDPEANWKGKGRTSVNGEPYGRTNSRILFKHESILVPSDSSVCFTHRKMLNDLIKPHVESQKVCFLHYFSH